MATLIMKQPSLLEWNWYIVMLGQALLGAITPNFRIIFLRFTGISWEVEVVFEVENQGDREEFADVIEEFAAIIEDVKDKISDTAYLPIVPKIRISSSSIPFVTANNVRMIYRKKDDVLDS